MVFLAYSGLRIGEAAALTWHDVNLTDGTVTVRHTLTEEAGKGLSLSVPKTRAARRTVPLPQHVVTALKAHKQAYPALWVFTTSSGAQMNPRAFNRRSFATALTRSGLNCRVHDLRHTAISLWIREGVDLPRVKAWAGHTDAAFTLNTPGRCALGRFRAIVRGNGTTDRGCCCVHTAARWHAAQVLPNDVPEDAPGLLLWLQGWYTSMCDGDWEHGDGIRIDTIDNPGWRIKVSLVGSPCDGQPFERVEVQRDKHDWVYAWVENGAFESACGPTNLSEAPERVKFSV